MACTTQSARDCIQNARPHLVGHLKNLSVIVENLHQQEVFTGEEVSKIEAETNDYDKTRKILDLVINKGEDACYLLLRIIDMTRKRTLERLPLLPVKRRAVSAETKEFDPHHWISCFPFKEDAQMDINYFQGPRPCHRFQAKLKSKAQKLSREFWMKSKNLFEENNKPDLQYTPLVLDTQGIVPPSKTKKFKSKKCRMSRPKKMRTYIPEDKREISPSDLLKTDKNILVVGKPGIGKTALSHELLKVWAERGGEELDYMFYFDMREAAIIRKDMSSEDLLFSVFTEPDEGKEDVLEDIKKNSDNVTVIFDGLTGLSSPVVQRLVKQDLLPDAKIIITCRPEDEEAFFSEDSLRVEVKGFSEQTIKTYLCATLGDKQKKVLSNVELFTLCHVPMYALMVAACCASHSPQPCTVTEIYINIVRFCLQINSNETNRRLNSFIKNKSKEILSLAEVAFLATEGKTVNLAELPCEDSCVFSFLKPLCVKAAITETETTYAFLHYTMQEFFAALWLLKSPDHIKAVFQQCLTEEKKHMKHLIPFMCRLLSEKSPSLMKCLISAEELRNTSDWFFREMITTFFPCLCEYEEAGADDSGCDIDILFLCQCLYESQCPEACACLLDNLDYCLDLSGVNLDPYPCSAVAYVITQSKERKIRLNLEDTSVSEQGMRQLLGCLKHVQWCDPLTRQISKNFLLSEGQIGFDGNELHLPAEGETQLFERAVEVLQNMTTKVNVCLHWDRGSHACHSLCEALIQALPFIRSLSFRKTQRDPGRQDLEQQHLTLDREKGLLLDLCLKAVHKGENCGNAVNKLFSLFHVAAGLNDLLLVFYERLKTERCLNVLPSLRSLFQSIPSVWSIDLSKRKASILLEVLKLQAEKKHVKLTGCSHGESEVKSFLQCLPYISQLSFCPLRLAHCDGAKFLVNLFCAAAAEREQETGQMALELLSSVCTDKTFLYNDIDDDGGDDDDDGDDDYKEDQCDFLLDLYSHLKDCETKTGLRVLPSLRPVVQSTPSVWVIDLSERKASILLEVLKLQTEKKHVELRGCSHGESEVKSFLQCLPYISQLSFYPWLDNFDGAKLLANLFCAAAEREQETGATTLELLSSVCTYETFPYNHMRIHYHKEYHCDFLLELWSHVKDYETKTGLRVLSSLRPLFQSTPSVWFLEFSQRKASILLEVLKLQAEKKRVELTDCSHEESEVKSLLQCLPYISQLSFYYWSSADYDGAKFLANLFCAAAAEREQETGQMALELLSSVCTNTTFPFKDIDDDDDDYKKVQCDFLLDLYSHLKDYETKTGLRVLPLLQPLFQSTPSAWSIDFSKRKASILLEVLKLQAEKKRVELTGGSHEESEVKSLLQCLPYISQLSFYYWSSADYDGAKFLANLFCAAAAEREQETGQTTLELLSSVCTYETFPYNQMRIDEYKEYQCDILLDLWSHLKDYETKTGLRVLPSLRPVVQSTPSVWVIDLSERKASILLEVLKLQAEKKHVKLTGCSHEESEVKSLLQCLPYISQLSFNPWWLAHHDGAKFLANLFCAAAAEREQETGQTTLELLSSVCTYETFPYNQMRINHYKEDQCKFLLDLCSHVKDYETKTGLRVLPSLRPLFQSTPSVWSIDLSERKASILLEVLKLQTKKKRVKLTGCSHGESEVKSFLQCLPYISQLRMSEESFQQLLALLCEIQDKDLTQSFLSKVDLTSHCLNWELLHYLLQQSAQPITVGLRKNPFLQESITHLLPFLDRIVFKRSSPSFVLTAIRELHRAQASHIIPSLVKSFDHVINLTCRELDSNDCAALLFTLTHSDRVHLNLTWTSIPAGETESILFTLDKVSQLSVDRTLLLHFVHCCAASDAQQEAAPGLLRTLQYQLDLSSSASVELLEHGQTEPLSLTAGDCRAISTVLTHSSQDTELDLRDCEVQDGALDLLFPVLDRVHLRASKALVLQLVSLVPVNRERDTVRRAVSLCRALGRELDLSHTTLDQRSCGALVLMLDHCEGLTELDLSYCELTDQLLLTLATQLHKVQVLDLSHNEISDASAGTLLQLVSINPSIHTVRLFRNSFVDMSPFKKHQQFEIW